MVTQALLWQYHQQSADFSELCSALYERELGQFAQGDYSSIGNLQSRLKSLPHYVKSTAFAMLNAQTPLTLDIQNASWSAKQARAMPVSPQTPENNEMINTWYKKQSLAYGLVVPIALQTHIVLDCIDRVDAQKQRFRTNVYGWFDLGGTKFNEKSVRLLKPSKKVMTAACTGHCWQNQRKVLPIMPSLRELLLSCSINWRNFKQPVDNLTID